jgi:hypothetical protein
MTIVKKREALSRFCDKFDSCDDCPLYVKREEYDGCYTDVSDEVVERNYKIAFSDVADAAESVGDSLEKAAEALAKYSVIPSAQPDKVQRHESICHELNALYARKNADYGDSFHKTYVEEGMAMARIRLSDKLERFKRLTKSNEQHVHDESVRDTLIDLANYAILTVMEIDGGRNDKSD